MSGKAEYQFFKAHGLCTLCKQKDAIVGMVLCQDCRIKKREMYDEKRRKKQCFDCNRKVSSHHVRCWQCRKKDNQKHMDTYVSRRLYSKCYRCGIQMQIGTQALTCPDCLAKRRELYAQKRSQSN